MEQQHSGRKIGAGAPRYSLMNLAGVFAVALAVVAVLFDWGTWIELNVSVLYGVPLVFAAAARRRRLVWTLAFVLIGMTFAVYLSQTAATGASSQDSFLLDRVLSAISVVLSAGILDAWLRSLQVRERQSLAIQDQNARLEAVNRELVAHKEEISRKNEELERRGGEIEQVSKRKTQMLASISHDIRSPIQSISLLAEVIRRTAEQPDQLRKIPALAQRLKANAESAVDFLSEVIDVASFDMGRITIINSEFHLDELIARQLERALPVAESKGLSLVAEPCQMLLKTDRVKLGRIIGNLVGNAVKFTSTGSVTVGCGLMRDDRVFVRVSDTGRGIKPEDLDRIFAEFAQIDHSQPQSGGGWGLGLPISRRLARLAGGEIEVQSQLDKGSVFTICLPPSTLVVSEESAVKRFLDRPMSLAQQE
jgi:signal transduction histidine kinase